MAKITTLAGMRSYILTQLGDPVITVELATTQIDSVIEDSIQIYQEYHTGEGNYLDYIALNVSPGVSAFNVSAYDLASVIDFNFGNGANGIDVLFSTTNALLYQDWVVYGNYPGGPGGGYGSQGMVLAGYDISMMYLEDIKEHFSTLFYAQFSVARQEILLTPTPSTSGIALLSVYKKEAATNLYNDRLVKRLCVAKAKIQWGNNIGKYTMSTSTGMILNFDRILTEGTAELEKVMDDIQHESEGPMFWIA